MDAPCRCRDGGRGIIWGHVLEAEATSEAVLARWGRERAADDDALCLELGS